MADEETTLDNAEPGLDPTSDSSEPVDAPAQDSSPDGSGQPPDDVEARRKRLEANFRGQKQQLERERAELARQRAELAAAARPAPPAPEPVDEVAEEREYQQALVDSNYAKMKDIRDRQRKRDLDRFRAEQQAAARTFTEQQQRQASVTAYLQSRRLPTDPKSGFFQTVQQRVEAARVDPAYYFTHDNPAALAAIITNEVMAEHATKRDRAGETARRAATDAAFTESSGAGNGAPPGQKPSGGEPIYLREDEKAYIANRARKDGITIQAAQKKYWEFMNPDEKRRRIAARSA